MPQKGRAFFQYGRSDATGLFEEVACLKELLRNCRLLNLIFWAQIKIRRVVRLQKEKEIIEGMIEKYCE